MQLWLCPILAFLLGSIPFGLIISRARGVNIRKHGSGNIGATNVLRVMGKKAGIACLVLDMLKGLIPVVVAINLIQIAGKPVAFFHIAALDDLPLILPAARQFEGQMVHVLTGLAAVLGHNYSPWVGFKGGKGIATSAGVLIALMPAGLVLLVLVWLVVFAVSRYVSVASITAAATLPLITLWGSWHHGRIQDGTWNKPLFIFSLVIGILAIWKHRDNIRRLREGTEHRFSRKPKTADA